MSEARLFWTVFILFVYLFASACVWGIRSYENDCKDRYVDYVFPISFLHCELKP